MHSYINELALSFGTAFRSAALRTAICCGGPASGIAEENLMELRRNPIDMTIPRGVVAIRKLSLSATLPMFTAIVPRSRLPLQQSQRRHP